MIIPLGLDKPLAKIPIATLIILAITCFFYKHHNENNSIYELSEITKKSNIKNESSYLFTNYCVEVTQDLKACEKYKHLIENKFFEIPDSIHQNDLNFLNELHDHVNVVDQKTIKLLNDLESQDHQMNKSKIKSVLKFFSYHMYDPNNAFSHIKGVTNYSQSLQEFQLYIKTLHSKYNQLSSVNLNLSSILNSQVTHGGIIHLVMNIFLLFVFGAFIEQRVNSLLFVCIYFLGGSLAVTLHTYFVNDPFISLIGASGNVYVLVGIFFVLFKKFSMRVFVPLPMSNKIQMPVIFLIQFLFVLSDLSGFIDNYNDFVMSSNIAHAVHLFGLTIGLMFGLILKKIYHLPESFVSSYEYDLYNTFLSEQNLDKKISIAKKILFFNISNQLVIPDVFKGIILDQRLFENNDEINTVSLDFVKKYIKVAIDQGIHKQGHNTHLKLLKKIPYSCSFCFLLQGISQENILIIAEQSLCKNEKILSLRILESYLFFFSRSKMKDSILLTMESIVFNSKLEMNLLQDLEQFKVFILSKELRNFIDYDDNSQFLFQSA